MKKFVASTLILLFFTAFAAFMYAKKQTCPVLNITSPSVLEIDLNKNGMIDDNEIICLPDIDVFSIGLREEPPLFVKDIKLSKNEIISLGYLASDYANGILSYKPVKVQFTGKHNHNCRFGEVIIDGEKYSTKLLSSGYAARNGKFSRKKFDENLLNAKKLNLVILNHKSYKYHTLDCEYGLLSSDYTIIPSKQIPEGAAPCKVCHVKHLKHSKKNIFLRQPPPIISDGKLQLILTDSSTKLAPDKNCTHKVCTTILDKINNSKVSIDMALYGFDNIPKIYSALKNAKARGVKIRLVYDKASSSEKDYYSETENLFELVDGYKNDYLANSPSYTNQLMHNKFLILDNKIVITGSMNMSSTGLSGYNTNAILLLESKDIANLFTAEFEQMFSGKFHNLKTKLNLPNRFIINDSVINVYFSPYDRTTRYIIPLINNAEQYIYIPAFLLTHNDLAVALINAKHRGVDVRVIIDANNTSTRSSKHVLLRKNHVQLKTEIYAGKMHSKSMIIDDTYIVVGSMNFSASGEHKNDENTIIIKNKKLAVFYRNHFLYQWNKIPDKWLYRSARAEGFDSIGSCSDGIDNNFDGYIDKDDDGCKR